MTAAQRLSYARPAASGPTSGRLRPDAGVVCGAAGPAKKALSHRGRAFFVSGQGSG